MATTDYGVFSYGLQIPSFEEWQKEYYNLAKTTYGSEVSVNQTSVIGQLLNIPCYQDISIWQMLEAVYNSQTLNGAEGVFLDDVLNQRGVFRKSASAGSGYAFIHTNANASWTSSIDTTYYFNASNEKNYQVTATTQYRSRIGAYKVSLSDIQSAPVSSITFYMQNYLTGEIKSKIITVNLTTALETLKSFILDNINPSDSNNVFIYSDILYIGFSSSNLEEPRGLGTDLYFYASRDIGEKWSLFPVKCQVTGTFDVFSGGILGITPTPSSGFIGVGNFEDFSSGSAVETDAEYRARYNATADESTSATRPAIYKAVSDLDGVSKVRIYDNPTTIDQTSASALTFNTVVFGGIASEIAQTIYAKKPINTLTSGTSSYLVSTEDGGTEVIKFTPAESVSYDIKFRYKKLNELSLTQTEISNITTSLNELEALFLIGSSVFNSQIATTIYNNTTFGDITYLEVLSKLSSESEDSYTTSDLTPEYYQIISINSDNLIFEQVV